MTAEVADGWIPMLFMPEKATDVWGASLDAGRGQARSRPRARCRSPWAACWPSARARR